MSHSIKLDLLKKARELISKEERWTHSEYARDSSGNVALLRSVAAVCFCSYGAILKVTDGQLVTWPALGETLNSYWEVDSTISTFNDSHTHAEVLAAWDRAIAAYEASLVTPPEVKICTSGDVGGGV